MAHLKLFSNKVLPLQVTGTALNHYHQGHISAMARAAVKMILQKVGILEKVRNIFEHLKGIYRLKYPKIEILTLYANTVCNAHCPMCDVAQKPGEGFAKPLHKAPKNLPLPLLEKILNDEIISNRRIAILFAMTEPLLSPEFTEMIKMCKERGHWVKAITNGSLLAQKAKQIAPYLDCLQISLDGPQELHDKIRGKDFFSKAITGIKTLREERDSIRIEINFTIFNWNYFLIFDFVKLLDSLGIRIDLLKIQLQDFISQPMVDKQISQYPAIKQEVSSFSVDIDINAIDIPKLYKQLELVWDYSPKNIGTIAFKPLIKTKTGLMKYFNSAGEAIAGSDMCTNPNMAIAINTAGNVYWHTRCFSDYILGNVNNQSLRSIFYGKKALYFRNKFKESNYCMPSCTRCCGVMKMQINN